MNIANWRNVAIIGVVVALGGTLYYTLFLPRHSVAYYYDLIAAQESVLDASVTAEEWEAMYACKNLTGALAHKRTQDCLQTFYVDYTRANGARKAFAHLATIEKESDSFIEDCHYVSHGIGRAQLQVDKGDVGRSFATLSEEAYFKNVSTCGNGYYHGIIEEYSKNATEKESLVEILSKVCKDPGSKNQADCFHGMGHAAFVQLEYDLASALFVCDNVTNDPLKNYACSMGVFMEMSQDMPTQDLVEVEDGVMKFKVCDTLDERHRTACYAQHSVFFENHTFTPKDYKKNIQYCAQIKEEKYRMVCVKFFAGRAMRVMKYDDVGGMCKGTSTDDEKIMCTAVFASRIARSIDATRKTPLFVQAVKDVCRTLPFLETPDCIDIVLHRSDEIYFDPHVDSSL